MLSLLLAAAITLIVAYIVYVLVTSYGSGYADNSFDAFIDRSASPENSSNTALLALLLL